MKMKLGDWNWVCQKINIEIVMGVRKRWAQMAESLSNFIKLHDVYQKSNYFLL